MIFKHVAAKIQILICYCIAEMSVECEDDEPAEWWRVFLLTHVLTLLKEAIALYHFTYYY